MSNEYPQIGTLLPNAKYVINKLFYEYNCEIIVWTCRQGQYKDNVKQFLIEQKIPFTCINENTPAILKRWNNCDCRKVFADFYIDDKGIFTPANLDWMEILEKIAKYKITYFNKFL